MLKARKQISHKEIKEDQLITFYSKVADFYYKFQNQILIGLGVLVAAVLLSVLYFWNQSSKETEAAELFAKVHTLIEQANYEKAIDGDPALQITGLKAIADDFNGTPTGELAAFYTGSYYYNLKKFDEAKEYFNEVDSSDPLIQSAAIAGYAATLEVAKEYADAASKYKKAAKLAKNSIASPRYLYLAGLNYAEAKELSSAVDCFKDIKENYEKSSYAKDADKYIAMYSSN